MESLAQVWSYLPHDLVYVCLYVTISWNISSGNWALLGMFEGLPPCLIWKTSDMRL